jgi:DNA-binding PadR family transcriptional regulator
VDRGGSGGGDALNIDLDGLVLALLENGMTHGREIARALPSTDAAAVHRALRRLEREGLVNAVPPRRFLGRRAYRLTRDGDEALAVRRLEWRSAKTSANRSRAAATSRSRDGGVGNRLPRS